MKELESAVCDLVTVGFGGGDGAVLFAHGLCRTPRAVAMPA